MSRAHQDKIRRSLRFGFRARKLTRALWLVLALGSTSLLVIVIFELTQGRQPDSHLALTTLLVSLTTIILGVVDYLGPPDVIGAVNAIDPSPDAECVSLLLQSLGYVFPRSLAWPKLAAILPSMSPQEAQLVPARHWSRFYRQAATVAIDYAPAAFSTALNLGHREAMPYLQKTLQHEKLRDEVRQQLRQIMESFDCLT